MKKQTCISFMFSIGAAVWISLVLVLDFAVRELTSLLCWLGWLNAWLASSSVMSPPLYKSIMGTSSKINAKWKITWPVWGSNLTNLNQLKLPPRAVPARHLLILGNHGNAAVVPLKSVRSHAFGHKLSCCRSRFLGHNLHTDESGQTWTCFMYL